MSLFPLFELDVIDPVPERADELLKNALGNALLLSGVTTGDFAELSAVVVVSNGTRVDDVGLDFELDLERSESLGKSVGTVSVAQAEGVSDEVERITVFGLKELSPACICMKPWPRSFSSDHGSDQNLDRNKLTIDALKSE